MPYVYGKCTRKNEPKLQVLTAVLLKTLLGCDGLALGEWLPPRRRIIVLSSSRSRSILGFFDL